MTRRSYVLDVWLSDNGAWLALTSTDLGFVTGPDVPGAGAQALVWIGAAAFWFAFVCLLVGVLWRPWSEPAPERREPPPAEASGPSAEVVPLRPAPSPPKGLH